MDQRKGKPLFSEEVTKTRVHPIFSINFPQKLKNGRELASKRIFALLLFAEASRVSFAATPLVHGRQILSKDCRKLLQCDILAWQASPPPAAPHGLWVSNGLKRS